MRVVSDIEADGLNATRIHYISCKDLKTKKRYRFYEDTLDEFRQFAEGVTEWIGHNFLLYDAPTLNRLAGTSITTSQVTDTLILSKMDKPDREVPLKMKEDQALLSPEKRKGPHSLKAWGYRCKLYKGDFDDFSRFTPEMQEYGDNDVDIAEKTFLYLVKRMQKFSIQSIRMEHTVAVIIEQMRRNGVAYDRQKAALLEAELVEQIRAAEKEVQETMPPLPKFLREVTPKYKKDGTMSVVGLKKVHEKPLEVVAGPFSLIDFPEFNLGSRDQVAEQLIKKGWKPKKFTETGKPQIDEEVLEGIDIPECRLIHKYMMLSKRLTDVRKWNMYSDEASDGHIHGYVDPLGANTNRMTHNSPNMGQVTSTDKPYGKEQRELFTTRDSGRKFVGADASGLEARCLAHRIDDAEFTQAIIESDVHTFHQKFFNVPTRNGAKPVYYCLVYGGGDWKFGQVLNGDRKLGAQLRAKYYDRFPKLKEIQDRYSSFNEGDLLRAIDGRFCNVRSGHSALNLDLQSMGAIICKYWMIEVMKQVRSEGLDALLVLCVHDELQFDVAEEHAERLGEITKEAMKRVEKMLKMNCPLDAEYKIGDNWSETH